MRHRLMSVPLLFALVASACAPAPATTPTGGATGGVQAEKRAANQVLNVAQLGMPASMSPEASNTYISVYFAMYDPVVTLDEKFNVKPWVAEKWSQPNPTTWRLQIRPDLKFSNGDPLTADDIEFTGKLILETRTPQLVQLANLTEVKKVDNATVDFVTKVPDASIMPGLAYVWVMPKRYYNEVGKNGFAAKPVGSGPYDLTEFRSADLAKFKQRPTAHAFRKPIATEITFRSLTEQAQMIAGMRTGDLDALIGQISADRIDELQRGNYTIESKLISVVTALFSQPENKERNTPLNDKRVRLALNYAVDKDAIAKQVFRGFAKSTGQLSIPSSPSWDDNVKAIPYDVAQAKKLLAEAGYPNGFKLPIGLEYTPLTGDQNLMLAIQGYLKEVGVDMAVTSYELGQFLDKFYGRNGQSKGDIFITATGDTNGFATTILGYYTCNKPLHWWCNPEFDKQMELAAGEPDVAKRGVIMKKAMSVFRDDVSHIFLFIQPTFIITSPKVKGFTWTSDAFYNWDTAYRIE